MKKILIAIAVGTFSFAACNTNRTNNEQSSSSATNIPEPQATTGHKTGTTIDKIVTGYLHIKNALTNDDGSGAANGGTEVMEALATVDTASITASQQKAFTDLADDIKENAEHISKNGGKIAHQREHFEILSKDIYDLIKAFGTSETLYKDYCPMYNDGKGAAWVSETKDIKNPYFGKEMPTCGEVKEEIKK